MGSTLTFGDMRTTLEKEIDAVVLERVQKGLDLLREKHGEDFADHIDPVSLNMASASYCVLGQLYRDYTAGTNILDIDGIGYGFDAERAGGYYELTEIWSSVIKQIKMNRVTA